MFTLCVKAIDENEVEYFYDIELDFFPEDEVAYMLAAGLLFDNDWAPGSVEWEYYIDVGDTESNEHLN